MELSSTTLGDVGAVAGSDIGEGGTSIIEIGPLAIIGCGVNTIGVADGAGAVIAFAATLGSAGEMSGKIGIGAESRLECSLDVCTFTILDGEPTGTSGGDCGGVKVGESVRE